MKSLLRFAMVVVGVLLLVPVHASAAKRYSLGERTLKEGLNGQDVRALQKFLTKAGVRTSVDGVFGSGTKKAVEDFERSQRRLVDGKVSKLDVTVLRDVVANGGAVAGAATTGGALPKNQPVIAAAPAPPPPLVLGPGMIATVGADGLAIAPAAAPPIVHAIINAGNLIAKKPYIFGGGHAKWEDDGYDCSGSVSYALHGGGLLEAAMPSGSFMNWGEAGPGQWLTLYAHGGHIYMTVAGLRFDTSGAKKSGTRWQADMRPTKGYQVRHVLGL